MAVKELKRGIARKARAEMQDPMANKDGTKKRNHLTKTPELYFWYHNTPPVSSGGLVQHRPTSSLDILSTISELMCHLYATID